MEKDVEKLADDLAGLTTAELSNLIKILKDKYHLEASTHAPIKEEKEEEVKEEVKKTSFNVVLVKTSDVTTERLGAVKIVNRIMNVGLKAANDLTKELPVTIMENIPTEEAESIKAEFAAFNAVITLN